MSWQIQRQAGTPKALNYAVESLGGTPTISAWYQQRPLGVAYTFDVQAIIGRSWSRGDHNRLIHRINAAKSERDQATIAIVHKTVGGLRLAVGADPGFSVGEDSPSGALPEVILQGAFAFCGTTHKSLSDGELELSGALPQIGLVARLNGAWVAWRHTINDYDFRVQS
ncbi:phage tail protein [Pseudomonas veronii]|nr:phage tail protein [Pseudomonas veronii]UHH31369.1 phage tail protein [Pseudomonas veronii]